MHDRNHQGFHGLELRLNMLFTQEKFTLHLFTIRQSLNVPASLDGFVLLRVGCTPSLLNAVVANLQKLCIKFVVLALDANYVGGMGFFNEDNARPLGNEFQLSLGYMELPVWQKIRLLAELLDK